MKLFSAVFSIVLFAAIAWGQEDVQSSDETQKDTQAAAESPGDDPVQARNDMDGTADIAHEPLRDPFWPLGYDPVSENSGLEGDDKSEDEIERDKGKLERSWSRAQDMIVISGLSRMGSEGYFAIINNQMVTDGDTISIKSNDGIFVWKVSRISAEGVELKRMQANVAQD